MLERIVAYAFKNIPFYSRTYRSLGLDKNPIKTQKDLERLPIITKQDIQKAPQDFVPEGTDLSKCLQMHTSGSTGKPLKIYYGEKDDDYSKANNLRSFLEAGYRYGDTFVSVSDPDWAQGRYFSQKTLSWQKKLNLFYPIDVDMRKSPSQLMQDILKIGKCDVLYGYPTNIFLLAKALQRI